MHGSEILARSLSVPTPMGREGRLWQYHSRSDRHSKIACWAILYDLLRHCRVLREQAENGAITFGINHRIRDFNADRAKDMDLVVCVPDASVEVKRSPRSFESLADSHAIQLTPEQKRSLAGLGIFREAPVGGVRIALEAKACMTEHSKARPRLFDELRSSHEVIHGASATAIAVGFVMVNAADTFRSPARDVLTKHRQPDAANGIVEKIRQLPRRSSTGDVGFDALGVSLIACVNDGETPVELYRRSPAPQPGSIFHYEQMIQRITQVYESRFPLR